MPVVRPQYITRKKPEPRTPGAVATKHVAGTDGQPICRHQIGQVMAAPKSGPVVYVLCDYCRRLRQRMLHAQRRAG